MYFGLVMGLVMKLAIERRKGFTTVDSRYYVIATGIRAMYQYFQSIDL
jgi:hypothetical protein